MNLAILHYHLNRGGVTRVVENQLAALDAVLDPAEPWPVAVIYGGRRNGWNEDLPGKLRAVRLSLYELPALDYDQQQDLSKTHPAGEGKPLADQLADLLGQIGFGPQETVLHVHNHALGKNAALPAALTRLAADGYPLLLQIHDFAEDFRVANYRRLRPPGPHRGNVTAALYPQAPHVHYAVLNGRDQEILQAAGVPSGEADKRLHLLPNPVPPMDRLPSKSDARGRLAERFDVAEHQRFVLYPVRCIRRKNVGEALLYAALAPPDTVIGLTLPPLNPDEVPIYETWKKLAEELDLPCRFETGAPGGLSFAENLAAADLILTTSLAEGFGMVFLEAWLAGHCLLGRDLPEITRDFTELGLRFDWLRPRLVVPVEWVGIDTFQQMIIQAYGRTLDAYGRDEPEDLTAQSESRTEGGLVDFGDLDETLQQQVLRIVCRDGKNRRRVLLDNPRLEQALSPRGEQDHEAIAQNAEIIRQHFSCVPSGRRLLDLYRRVLSSPQKRHTEPLSGAPRILDQFLAFGRFRPIRS